MELHGLKTEDRKNSRPPFADMTDDKGTLDMEWEKLRLEIPIGVGTAQQGSHRGRQGAQMGPGGCTSQGRRRCGTW